MAIANSANNTSDLPTPESAPNKWVTMAKADGITPMMAQFLGIKCDYPDCLLFYRMGDFYELFFDDAVAAAGALDITLTKRGKHDGEDIPMCGVPVHASEMYLSRLIRKKFKVAVCEQTEDPAEAKKRGAKSVVRREVVRLVTPGTLTEENLLNARAHNYLAALSRTKGSSDHAYSLAVCEISTGEFFILPTSENSLDADLARISPGELLVADTVLEDESLTAQLFDWRTIISPLPKHFFDSIKGDSRLKSLFEVSTLDGFADMTRADLAAAGALVEYLDDTQKGQMPRLKPPHRLNAGGTMMIDAATRRSLELTRTQNGETAGSLLSVIDRTVTGAGARLLTKRLAAPITDPVAINARLDAVGFFLGRLSDRADIRKLLRSAPDIERALSRLAMDRGGPRDLTAIRDGLISARDIRSLLTGPAGQLDDMVKDVQEANKALAGHHELSDELGRAMEAEPPLITRDGGYIQTGYSAALDEFRTLRNEGRRLITALEARYRDETKINGLKIKHNNMLGYHVEVTARNADPLMGEPLNETFIHRQTMANAVRFSSSELSKLAGDISSAADRAIALESEIFAMLVKAVISESGTLGETAFALASLDTFSSLAELADIERYNRPEVDDTLAFEVIGGRHPVVEQALRKDNDTPFVANDCDLNQDERLWLITGPNMAGKSTFLRQNALIAIMAQIGSYVPAAKAHVGAVDRLFSRVGASDDLAHGRSTFMVEMVETAAILNQAGPKSLVILDEIGRGTATYDGLSIAWAAVENLHNINQSRALFATHYHELTSLKETLESISLRSMKVREWKGEVVFLHEVASGAADRSYGIQVAKLAGLPPRVINRAKQVLDHLESTDKGEQKAGLINDLPLFQTISDKVSTALPASKAPNPAIEALSDINADDLTPREALELLYELKRLNSDEVQ